ncbi:hypothetical protein [Ekhidna sp.]|uniref:hypothetical protein n=1 Tax=Ekhidna sp. TaxID=2608089 RepID=UPI0032EFF63C
MSTLEDNPEYRKLQEEMIRMENWVQETGQPSLFYSKDVTLQEKVVQSCVLFATSIPEGIG